eukprot:8735498-Pyramimonas_sp.AAC.1
MHFVGYGLWCEEAFWLEPLFSSRAWSGGQLGRLAAVEQSSTLPTPGRCRACAHSCQRSCD